MDIGQKEGQADKENCTGQQNSVIPMSGICQVCSRIYSCLMTTEGIKQSLSLSVFVQMGRQRGLKLSV